MVQQTLTRQHAAEREATPHTIARPPTRLPSPPSHTRQIQPALEDLCSMKNQAQFTPHAASVWMCALSIYDPAHVTQSLLEMGLSPDPFPDLGKVIQKCERKRREAAGTMPKTDGPLTLPPELVGLIAERLELEV